MATSPRFVIGCPIRDREWIIDLWRDYVAESFANAGIDDYSFVFVASAEDARYLDDSDHVVVTDEVHSEYSPHDWKPHRYVEMVNLRNTLLEEVRKDQPDFFLSLDSDILLHPKAVLGMLEVFDMHPEAWAVGGKAHLSAGEYFPTYGMWKNRSNHAQGMTRGPYFDVRIADVLMAVVMMKPQAYAVDYAFHSFGEDLGWSSQARKAGAKFWWDGRYCSKHVMRQKDLGVFDERSGY